MKKIQFGSLHPKWKKLCGLSQSFKIPETQIAKNHTNYFPTDFNYSCNLRQHNKSSLQGF